MDSKHSKDTDVDIENGPASQQGPGDHHRVHSTEQETVSGKVFLDNPGEDGIKKDEQPHLAGGRLPIDPPVIGNIVIDSVLRPPKPPPRPDHLHSVANVASLDLIRAEEAIKQKHNSQMLLTCSMLAL